MLARPLYSGSDLTPPPPAIPIRDLEDKKDAFPGLASESSNSPSYALFEKTLSNLTAIRDAKTVVTIVAGEACPVQSKQSYRKSYAQLLRGTSSTRLLIGVGRGAGWRPLQDLHGYTQNEKPSSFFLGQSPMIHDRGLER